MKEILNRREFFGLTTAGLALAGCGKSELEERVETARIEKPPNKQSQYGPCGIFCGACGAQDCDGCQSSNVDDEHVSKCKFRTCTRERNLDFCCFCEDYPCKELNEFMNDKWPHHWTMEPNLAFIRDHGVDEWLKTQKQEWSCKSCGSEIMWYQKKCKCGKQLEAWQFPG